MARVALSRVLSHLRRGRCSELWDALIHEADARLGALKEAVKQQQKSGRPEAKTNAAAAEEEEEPEVLSKRPGRQAKGAAKKGIGGGPATAVVTPAPYHSDEDGEVASAQRSLARAIALVAQAVHYFRCGTALELTSPVACRKHPIAVVFVALAQRPPLLNPLQPTFSHFPILSNPVSQGLPR